MDSNYFDILQEIEKEGVVDIDTWSELRELRNKIAHDYYHSKFTTCCYIKEIGEKILCD